MTGAPTDPCRNYQLMELADRGLRHPNVTVSLDRANTCDYYFDESRLLWFLGLDHKRVILTFMLLCGYLRSHAITVHQLRL